MFRLSTRVVHRSAAISGTFHLVVQDGREVTDGRFVIHFGYPPCADRMSDQVRKLIHSH